MWNSKKDKSETPPATQIATLTQEEYKPGSFPLKISVTVQVICRSGLNPCEKAKHCIFMFYAFSCLKQIYMFFVHTIGIVLFPMDDWLL